MTQQRPFAADDGWRYVDRPGGPTPGGSMTLPPGASTEQYLNALLVSGGRQEELLAAILQELREQVAQGYVVAVTANLTVPAPPIEVPFIPNLFTLGITNDGPGIIEYRVPNRGESGWVALNPTEVIQINFIKGVIASIGLRLRAASPPPGTNIRLVGTY